MSETDITATDQYLYSEMATPINASPNTGAGPTVCLYVGRTDGFGGEAGAHQFLTPEVAEQLARQLLRSARLARKAVRRTI